MTEPSLEERCARGMGWHMGMATVYPESEVAVWVDDNKIICAVVDWRPRENTNQAMMCWDRIVSDDRLMTLEEDKEEVLIHVGESEKGAEDYFTLKGSTKNEAICLAFVRAEESK